MENGGDASFVSVVYDDTVAFVGIVDCAVFPVFLGIVSFLLAFFVNESCFVYLRWPAIQFVVLPESGAVVFKLPLVCVWFIIRLFVVHCHHVVP